MDELANELKRQYDIIKTKTGVQLLYGVFDYLDLLQNQTFQEILNEQKGKTIIRELDIWSTYSKLYAEVYEPIKTSPDELVKQKFAPFWTLEFYIDAPFPIYLVQLVLPRYYKGRWKKFLYGLRIDKIHPRLLTLLRKKQFSKTQETVSLKSELPAKPIKPKDKLRFIDEAGILIIDGVQIEIDKQENKQNNAHKLLWYILVKNKNSFFNEFRFSDIAKSPAFNDTNFHFDKKSWVKYHNACRDVNNKILEKTGIPDFLLYGSSRRGTVRINSKHLQTLGLEAKQLG